MMRHVLVTMVTSAKLHSVSLFDENGKKSFDRNIAVIVKRTNTSKSKFDDNLRIKH